MGLGMGLTLLMTVLGLGQKLALVLMPMGLLMTTVFYASLYFTFIDCFMFGAPKELPVETGANKPDAQG